nr:hypothetical protein HUO10_000694 [Paraburkholderia busanensis]
MSDEQTKAAADASASNDLIEAVSIEQLADVLKAAGYRVTVAEQAGVVQLMSASQGIGFSVRFGNLAQGAVGQETVVRYLDYTLSCVLQVQGDYPQEWVASWNRTKRFARLADHGQFIALEMDVIVGGGVSVRHLRSTVELWDRLIQELLMHLRTRPVFAEQHAQTQAAVAAAAAGAGIEVGVREEEAVRERASREKASA